MISTGIYDRATTESISSRFMIAPKTPFPMIPSLEHAPDWTIGDRTYAAADVFAAVDPDGYAVALADFAAEREALRDDR